MSPENTLDDLLVYCNKRPLSTITLRGITFTIEDLEFSISKIYKGSQQTKDVLIVLQNKSFKIVNESIKRDYLKVFKNLINHFSINFDIPIKSIFNFDDAIKVSCRNYEIIQKQYYESIQQKTLEKIKAMMIMKLFFDF